MDRRFLALFVTATTLGVLAAGIATRGGILAALGGAALGLPALLGLALMIRIVYVDGGGWSARHGGIKRRS